MSKEMALEPKWKFLSRAAIFKDCLHVKTKIINPKSQTSPIDGLRFMDIWPQKLLSKHIYIPPLSPLIYILYITVYIGLVSFELVPVSEL